MNIREIAQLANVTPGTVSKVLNNYPDISEATRRKVLDVIKKNQYERAFSTRSLDSINSRPVIGIAIEGVYNCFYGEIEEALLVRFHNAGYTIMTFHDNYFIQDKKEKFNELQNYILKHNLQGMVYVGGNFSSVNTRNFSALSCPVIFVNTVLPENHEQPVFSSIKCNHEESASRQLQRLIDNGHKKIALMISSIEDNSVYGLHLKSYREVLKKNGLEENESNIVTGDYVYAKTYRNLKEHLAKHPDITAVCCSADVMVPAVLRAIHDTGKSVPKDMEVIGFDGLELLNYCVPSVTTFEQPFTEIVNFIHDLLTGLISKERRHQNITFDCSLILRESCR